MPDPETELRLTPFAQYRLGWSWLGRDLQVRGLGVPDESDELLRGACGSSANNSASMHGSIRNPPHLGLSMPCSPAPGTRFTACCDWPVPALAGSDVPGAQRNIVTGGPVSRGKINSAGNFVPTAPDGVIAGFGLPSPAIKLGKRFLFASDPDVNVYLYLDKDAYANDMKHFASGGGI